MGSSSYTTTTLGKYLPPPLHPLRAGWITRSDLLPLWARWRRRIQGSRHTMVEFAHSFLSAVAVNVFVFWQHVQCPSCLIVLRPPISVTPRSTGEEPPDIQEINRLPPNLYSAFFKAFKIKGIVDIFNSSCEAAACSLHQYIWSFPRIT